MREKFEIENNRKKEQFLLRDWDFTEDQIAVQELLKLVFKDLLEQKGLAVQNIFDEYKAMRPFLNFLGVFNKNFKHAFDGFVIENTQGEIVASVNIGYAMYHWEIAMVATHPDYRRRGFAKKLVTQAIEHAKSYGAKMCILEVLDINEPAYNLYRKLNFVHYDSITRMKLADNKLSDIEVTNLPQQYKTLEMKRNKKTNLARYELDKKITPKEVQEFHPVNKSKYHKPLIIRIIRPLAKLLLRVKPSNWTIYRGDELVGIINADLARKEGSPHRLELKIDPEYKQQLVEFMITFGLKQIKEKKTFNENIIVEFRSSEKEQQEIFEQYGFTMVEQMHLLGLKIE